MTTWSSQPAPPQKSMRNIKLIETRVTSLNSTGEPLSSHQHYIQVPVSVSSLNNQIAPYQMSPPPAESPQGFPHPSHSLGFPAASHHPILMHPEHQFKESSLVAFPRPLFLLMQKQHWSQRLALPTTYIFMIYPEGSLI